MTKPKKSEELSEKNWSREKGARTQKTQWEESVTKERQQVLDYLAKDSPITKKPYSENTKKSYKMLYDKLYACLEKDIVDSSQKKVVSCAEDQSNINSKQGILNIGLIVRKINDMPTQEIIDARDKNKTAIVENVKKTNANLDLPSYEDLTDFTEYLYENSKWTDYVINYLLLNYQVRNKDVNFTIIPRKKDATDKNKNYIWLTPKKAVWIRHDYKTEGKYGTKTITITNKKFLFALRRVKVRGLVFIPNEDQVGYYVKKSTLKDIGEAAYMKIIVNHFRGDLQKLGEISKNRGTNLETIKSNYDINLK
jgi:hypothetical protein